MLSSGECLHIVTRRILEDDIRRHFVGEVETCSDTVARVSGYAFIFDAMVNEFVRRPERRTRIVALGDSGLIINVLPDDVSVEDLKYETTEQNRLVVTDGRNFSLDINEFGALR